MESEVLNSSFFPGWVTCRAEVWERQQVSQLVTLCQAASQPSFRNSWLLGDKGIGYIPAARPARGIRDRAEKRMLTLEASDE